MHRGPLTLTLPALLPFAKSVKIGKLKFGEQIRVHFYTIAPWKNKWERFHLSKLKVKAFPPILHPLAQAATKINIAKSAYFADFAHFAILCTQTHFQMGSQCKTCREPGR